MCGYSGFYLNDSNRFDDNFALNLLKKMGLDMIHRGPDGRGEFYDASSGIGLSHRRLSIHDLSSFGTQPMASKCGRYQIVFNGEIYNFNKIKKDLVNKGIEFLSRTDTEVLLESIIKYGVNETLQILEGMFSFAFIDLKEKTIVISRDRLGEKPLYYTELNNGFAFSSNIESLKSIPSWDGEIDRESIDLLLRYKSIPAPYSIYKNVKKLEPGKFITLRKTSNGIVSCELSSYWNLSDSVKKGMDKRKSGYWSEKTAVNKLDELLTESVSEQMFSDVPLGAFLSGGVDSSTVVSVMQANSSKKVNTYSIGFDVPDYNEAEFAKKIADHLQTNHTEIYVNEQDALNIVPKLSTVYDEPFADSSQIPTYLVCELARKYVTVALSGDGGDELFCGYSRYNLASKLWNKLESIPKPIRSFLGEIVKPARRIAKPFGRSDGFINKLELANIYLSCYEYGLFYSNIMSDWKVGQHNKLFDLSDLDNIELSDKEKSMFIDSITYLPNDILTKVDRASMAVSLETRIPLLRKSIIDFAWELPLDLKYRNGVDKWVLKKVLEKYVPLEMFDRPKRGFAVPLQLWLIGPLREWAESLLSEHKLSDQGFFDVVVVRKMWEEHLNLSSDHSAKLWTILMFQDWYENTNHGYKG